MRNTFQRGIVLFVSTTFILSGVFGLIYEVLWTRFLADLMGGTALSQFVVLMVFMGGLALGAILIGRQVDRGGNGLLYYGWLEVGIGLYAVLFPFLATMATGIFYSLGANFGPGSPGLLLLKIFIASLLIALPSVAMGGTLPAVTRYLTSSQHGLRRNISLLYGLNSLGAVLGVLAGGFFVVHWLGQSASMLSTGILNMVLGISVLGFGRYISLRPEISWDGEETPSRRLEEVLDDVVYSPDTSRRAVIAAGLAGFAGMALQVAWIRYFAIVLGATHSAFTIVVAAFIFGIGLGALLVRSRWIGKLSLPLVLTATFLLTLATLVLGLSFYGRLPFEIGRFLAIIARTPYAWPYYLVLKFVTCFLLMLVPSMASGMIMPLCVRIAGCSKQIGRDVALVYGVNTLGALLGIGITSQLLFRMLTLPRTLQVIMLVYAAATIFLASMLREKGRKRILSFTVVLLAFHFLLWQPWTPKQLAIGRLNFAEIPAIKYKDFIESLNTESVVAELNGPDVQATVVDAIDMNTPFRALLINGKPDASNQSYGPDMATQILLSHLPMLLHQAPKNIFVLGLGSGITSGEVLKFPAVEKVTTVELAAEVFEASKYFAEDNGRYWENPKHRMVIDDGKTFLQLSKEKFDVISMEPTNVWQEGMAGLFSEDFFRLVKSRLAEDGLVVQWLHTYELDDLTVNIILKTFSRAFPSASVFQVNSSDLLLLGYGEKWRFTPLRLEHRFYQDDIRAAEESIGNVNPSAFLLREVMSRGRFKEYTTAVKAPVNTDNFPVLEQAAEFGRFIDLPVTIFNDYDSLNNPDGKDLLVSEYFRQIRFDPEQIKVVVEAITPGVNDKLRNSLILRMMDEPQTGGAAVLAPEMLKYIHDPELREIVMHPDYRQAPVKMAGDDLYNRLRAELLLWNKAASQIWAPKPERLQQLYARFALGVDRGAAGLVARDIAVSLAESNACNAAVPFLRLAEEKGGLAPETMEPMEVIAVFYCEARAGDSGKALGWWKLIEQRKIPQTEFLQAAKTTLDIKLGGAPPPPVYGRLSSGG